MLVLSRKVNDSIVIGDDVTVTLNRMSGNRVAVGIRAPAAYRILRGELKGSSPTEPVSAGGGSLVLSRKKDEKILIGDFVTITIVEIRGNSVSFGIEAPSEILVLRGELERHSVKPPALGSGTTT